MNKLHSSFEKSNLAKPTEFFALSPLRWVFVIFLTWILYLTILGLLQACGYFFGFNVWALSEDRCFIYFMLIEPSVKMTREFWGLNDRNPLAPFWWYLFKFIIKDTSYGLYCLRKCIDPLLAIVTFLTLNRLGRQKCPTFAFSVALIILLWNFSHYYDQILWVCLLVIIFNLLSVFYYCRYIDDNRIHASDLAISMLCYLIAISTYTLMSGVIFAIGMIALFRQTSSPSNNFRSKLVNAIYDVSFFIGIFIIYSLIWYSISRNYNTYYSFDFKIFSKQIFASINQFIFHSSYLQLWAQTSTDWSIETISLMIGISFLIFFCIFKFSPYFRMRDDDVIFPMGWVCVLLISIALPIVLVEATHPIWYPGSRSLMVQQFWQPLFYVAIIYSLLQMVSHKYKKNCTIIAVSLLGAFSTVLGLNYNHHLVLRTYYQQNLAKGIKDLNINFSQTPNLLLKVTNTNNKDMNDIYNEIPIYAQTMLNRNDFGMRIFTTYFNKDCAEFWRVQFNSNNKGVNNAKPLGKQGTVFYNNLLILFFDGKKVWIPKTVDQKDFNGFQVDWLRDQPIYQNVKL